MPHLFHGTPGQGQNAQVNLAEEDIRALCLLARDVFLDQPALLQLATPIKICGQSRDRDRYDMTTVWKGLLCVLCLSVVIERGTSVFLFLGVNRV